MILLHSVRGKRFTLPETGLALARVWEGPSRPSTPCLILPGAEGPARQSMWTA